MRMLLLAGGIAAVTFSVAGGSAVSSAQPGLPATPDPAECAIAPRPLPEFRSLLEGALTPTAATPGATSAAPEAAWPEGDPADAQTVDAVIATVREYLACINGGKLIAAQSLVTDAFLRRQFAELGPVVERLGGIDRYLDALGAATPLPTPPPPWRGALMSVREVRVLADGRVGAVVTVAISPLVGGRGTRDDYYVLRRVGNRLLIDFIEEAVPPAGTSGATPTPGE